MEIGRLLVVRRVGLNQEHRSTSHKMDLLGTCCLPPLRKIEEMEKENGGRRDGLGRMDPNNRTNG